MDEKKAREAIDFIKTLITAGNGDDRLYTAIEALEKQLPKKSVLKRKAYGGIMVCPICEASDSGKYCRYCGQKLDWSE